MTLIEQIKDLINRVENANNVDNGWVTVKDKTNEDGEPLKLFIAGYGGGTPAPNWYKDQIEEFKKNKVTKFVLTGISDEKQKEIEETVKTINSEYDIPDLIGVTVGSLRSNYAFNMGNGKTNAIRLNRKYYTNPELIKEKFSANCKSGFHPKGLKDVSPEKAILMHELGHSITAERDNKEFWNGIKDIRKRYDNEIKKTPDSKNFISRYAERNDYEFVAEAFSDAKLSNNPSTYSKEVLNLIDKHYKLNSSEAKQLRLFNCIMRILNEKKEEENDEYIITWAEEWGYGYPADEEEFEEWKKQREEKEEDTKENKKDPKADNSLEDAFTEALAEIILEQ